MKRRLFLLYEHGADLMPCCTGPLRLLRPLHHPRLREQFEVTAGRRFDGRHYDAVIVERMWRPDISPWIVEQTIADIRRSGSRMLFAADDNVFDIHAGFPSATWFTSVHVDMMERFASSADGVLVSTEALKERLAPYHPKIVVLENALDERLLVRLPFGDDQAAADRPLTIGYMGTRSHDEDLRMIAPALREVHRRYGRRVRLEILGVVSCEQALSELLPGVPFSVIPMRDGETDYAQFMLWFISNIHWDIALAPLCENAFTVCKSDIKLLDYSAIGAVGVFSRVRPYQEVERRELGLVADNHPDAWTDALDRLLADAALRARLRRNSQDYLFSERTIWRRADDWRCAFDQLLA